MGGENTFNNKLAIVPDVLPDGSLMDTSESVLL
jgi:hypothetical protein